MGPSCQYGQPPPASSQTLHEVFIPPTQGPAAWGGLAVHIEPMLHPPPPQASMLGSRLHVCCPPALHQGTAVPLPTPGPPPRQGSKAGTSPGSDCTNTLILHASHPHCLLSGVHTLLGAYSSCPVFAHTRHSLSTLFPAPPPSQNLPEH